MKRRDFFKLMGISSGAALSACKVIPSYKKMPSYLMSSDLEIIPGMPRYIRSTCMECPARCGISVKILEEKPIKLEGIEGHPINQGALCMRGQAALARLYHPARERIKQPLIKKSDKKLQPISWQDAMETIRQKLENNKSKNLRNVFLRSHTTGTLDTLIDEFCSTLEIERLKELEIYNHHEIKQANQELFGLPLLPHYRIDQCDALITLGADLIETFLSPVEWAQQYADTKRKRKSNFKWYHIEPYLTLTSMSADQRHTINPGSEPYLLAFLLHNLHNVHNLQNLQNTPNLPPQNSASDLIVQVPFYSLDQVVEATGLEPEVIQAIRQTLENAKQPLIISGGAAVGQANGPITALYTSLLQWTLGMIGKTVDFDHAFNYSHVGTLSDLKRFVHDCQEGKIGVAFFSQIYGLAVERRLANTVNNIPFKIIMTDMPGPLTELGDLVLPLPHFLESWGDAEPRQGVKCLVQPVINPMYDTKNEGDILLTLLERHETYLDYLADHWQIIHADWFIKGYITREVNPLTVSLLKGVILEKPKVPIQKNCLFILPSLRTFDGRNISISLLVEIPEPVTAISYGKWMGISTEDAEAMNLSSGDVVQVETSENNFKIPVYPQIGLPRGIMAITIDFFGEVFSNNRIDFPFCFERVKLARTNETAEFTVMSGGKQDKKRGILPFKGQKKYDRYTLFPSQKYKNYHWGMVINLDVCTGCSACIAACYIENNVAIVGESEHKRGREMSWLRIETYYNNPVVPEFILMICQQCNDAPCETVCPVYAAFHNDEGINAQVYNRCVGTRYCSNNCPYKVRRFNWFDHSHDMPLYKVSNPDLSVRPKGVMEKCTFCIQRIRFVKERAQDENRLIKDGEVIPACAQTCPTRAITFGNLLDPESKVSKLSKSEGVFRALEHLGTEPVVYYIKRGSASGGARGNKK